MEVAGVERRYYRIELATGEGELMLPVPTAEEIGLRPALNDVDQIENVLFDEPQELSSNYRSREAQVNRKIGSGDILELIGIIRDLEWYGHVNRLTHTDSRLKAEALKLASSELAICQGVTYETAYSRMKEMLRQAIRHHAEEEPVN